MCQQGLQAIGSQVIIAQMHKTHGSFKEGQNFLSSNQFEKYYFSN